MTHPEREILLNDFKRWLDPEYLDVVLPPAPADWSATEFEKFAGEEFVKAYFHSVLGARKRWMVGNDERVAHLEKLGPLMADAVERFLNLNVEDVGAPESKRESGERQARQRLNP
jgi:hypothetical protein